MKWTACELHTHTIHSDGDYTVAQLLEHAKRLGLEAIAITDHSTEAAHDELAQMGGDPCIPVIRGIEWTTFYGHALIIGSKKPVDWRDAEPDTIDACFRRVHEAGGITGVAHPYAPGDPICCGCHWEFNLRDWTLADMIEIWSGSVPQWKRHNQKAVSAWTSLLDSGIYVTAISARDWHGEEDDSTKPFAVTYLLLDGQKAVTDAAQDAVRNHHAFVTVGPTISVAAYANGVYAGIGGLLPRGKVDFHVSLDEGARRHVWEPFELVPESFVLIGSGGREILRSVVAGYGKESILTVEEASGWLRLEVHGTMLGSQAVLAVANPIVFA